MTGTLYEGQYTFLIISRSVLPRIKMFQTNFVEKIETHILCSINFFSKNSAVYELVWKNKVQPDRPQITIK
jgi:hypothetical protein